MMPRPGDEDASTGKSIGAVYDIWNRQVRTFNDSDGDGQEDAGEEIIAEYRYDGQNRRIREFLPRYTGTGEERTLADWTVRDDYYNQGWQLLETRKADGVSRSSLGGGKYAEPAAATSVYCQYVWSPEYIDALVCRDRDADGDAQTGDLGTSGSGLEERLVYIHDANYNVTALLRQVDSVWGVCERYSYDPYGQVTVLHGGQGYDPEVDGVTVFEWMPKSANPDGSPCVSRYDNEILYCGYRFDWETGLYNVRRRIYHPTLGRWTTRDPAGYVDGISLYAAFFVPGKTDPFGLQTHDSVTTTFTAVLSDLGVKQAAALAAIATLAVAQVNHEMDLESAKRASRNLRKAIAAVRDVIRTVGGTPTAPVSTSLKRAEDVSSELSALIATLAAAQRCYDQAVSNAGRRQWPDACEKAKDVLRQLHEKVKSHQKQIKEHRERQNNPEPHMHRDRPSQENIARAIKDWEKQIQRHLREIKWAKIAIKMAEAAVNAVCK